MTAATDDPLGLTALRRRQRPPAAAVEALAVVGRLGDAAAVTRGTGCGGGSGIGPVQGERWLHRAHWRDLARRDPWRAMLVAGQACAALSTLEPHRRGRVAAMYAGLRDRALDRGVVLPRHLSGLLQAVGEAAAHCPSAASDPGRRTLVLAGGRVRTASGQLVPQLPGEISVDVEAGGAPTLQANIRRLPIATAAVDEVWAEALPYDELLAESGSAVHEMGRVVRPGGRLFLVTGPGVPRAHLRRLLAEAGFGPPRSFSRTPVAWTARRLAVADLE